MLTHYTLQKLRNEKQNNQDNEQIKEFEQIKPEEVQKSDVKEIQENYKPMQDNVEFSEELTPSEFDLPKKSKKKGDNK